MLDGKSEKEIRVEEGSRGQGQAERGHKKKIPIRAPRGSLLRQMSEGSYREGLGCTGVDYFHSIFRSKD